MLTIRKRVQERFAELSPVQKRLVQKMLSGYEDFVFLAINEAAASLNVHKSTLVRLAQSRGYEGYGELREQLQLLFRQEVTPANKLVRTLADIDEETLYEQVIETEIQYLKESLKTIRTKDIHRAAKMLLGAERIFICGTGPQRALVSLLEFRLRRFQLDVVAVTQEGRGIFEILQLLDGDDVLVIINFGTFQRDHLNAASIAQEVGCPIILITETLAKELAERATLTLAARRGPPTIYHSNIVPMAVASAIVLDVARMLSPAQLASLERIHELRRRFGYAGEPNGQRDTEPADKNGH